MPWNLRLRSMRTESTSFWSYSNSTQEPRYGMILGGRTRPSLVKKTPGLRWSWRDDDPLGAVDDERAVVRHQRDVAEIDLLLLGVAHHARAGLRVAVIDEQAEGDLERHREGHPPLLAVRDRVLELQVDRIAADVALRDPVLVDEPALGQVAVSSCGWSVMIFGAAVGAGHAQVLEPLELAALALPVPDRVLDEVERAGLAEVVEREDAREDRLQALVGPLLGQQVHLQEALVATAAGRRSGSGSAATS